MHLQLTISLLASNRIPSIRRCLDSLVPILMKVPSELVIVDTSGNSQVRDLALQYTGCVVPFHWCNDFSKARNAGLEKARGEWFMFIDDDEWFEKVDEIVFFFTSGEYLNYNSASYLVRNYTDKSGMDYIDAHTGRMVRITPETRFEGAVHEFIAPYDEPIKVFSCYAHHFGYVEHGDRSKGRRNIPILEKELEQGKPTPHNYLQMAQEYMTEKRFAEAEAAAKECLELGGDDKTRAKSWCIAYLPSFINWQGDSSRAWETGKHLLRHPFCTEMASLRIYMTLTNLCIKLKKDDKNIITYAKAYHYGIAWLDSHPEQWFLQAIGGLGEQQSKRVEDSVYLNGFRAAVRAEDSRSALSILRWFPWGSREAEKLYGAFSEMLLDTQSADFLLECFWELDVEDAFVFLAKARRAWNRGDREAMNEYCRAAACSDNELVLRETLHLFFQSEGGVSLEPWMGRADLRQWESAASDVAGKAGSGQLAEWIAYLEPYLEEFPAQVLPMVIELQERLLVDGSLGISDEELLRAAEQYCQRVQQYGELVYQAGLLAPRRRSLLPRKLQFALQMGEVFHDLRRTNYPKVLRGLSMAAELYPPLCMVIRRILSPIQAEMENPAKPGTEFERLGTQVKEAVREMLRQGRSAEALPLIQQLSSLLPRDLEVLRLRQELWADREGTVGHV